MKYRHLWIDFSAGSHGNFLDFLINRFILETPGSPQNIISTFGTSHPDLDEKSEYKTNKPTMATHFSQLNDETALKRNNIDRNNDAVIQIKSNKNVDYIIQYNGLYRAGDVPMDIDSLEIDTIEKLNLHPHRFKTLADDIISKFGYQKNYKRADLRNLFYSKFIDNSIGLDPMNYYMDLCNNVHVVSAEIFFNFSNLIQELGSITNFLGKRNWFPSPDLVSVHEEFLNKNHGYQSYIKCQNILKSIVSGSSIDVKCNILEEAYINVCISRAFGIYDSIETFVGDFPDNTKIIHNSIIKQLRINRDI